MIAFYLPHIATMLNCNKINRIWLLPILGLRKGGCGCSQNRYYDVSCFIKPLFRLKMSVMAVTDLIVVHFALGSPFAVYRITRGNIRSPRSAVAVGVYFALWPIFAAAFIRDWFSISSNHPVENALDEKIRDLKSSIESLVFSNTLMSSIFDFREIFDRYVGLTLALLDDFAPTSNELFTISGHKDPSLAMKCTVRLNRRRLLIHQTQASDEFVEMIRHITSSHSNKNEVIWLGLQISALLKDRETYNKLSLFALDDLSRAGVVIAASSNCKRSSQIAE